MNNIWLKKSSSDLDSFKSLAAFFIYSLLGNWMTFEFLDGFRGGKIDFSFRIMTEISASLSEMSPLLKIAYKTS